MDPILESSGACQHVGERIAAAGRLGGGEQLSSTVNESVTAPSAMVESGAGNLVVPREQTAFPDASEGMVGPAIRPPCP